MGLPPRPDKPTPRAPTLIERVYTDPLPFDAVNRTADTEPSPAPSAPAELDEDTRRKLADVIARAIAGQLGHVRISSIPPSAPEPRSSIRVAAKYAGKYTGKVGKLSVYVSGALSIIGTVIAWWRPEFAAPLAQAAKLIAGVIVSAAGGGAPAPEPPPAARDVPALVAPASDAAP